jgi:hypothetical protein
MSRNREIQVVLGIAIALFMSVSLSYSQYYVLSEADFLSRSLQFENSDQEGLCLGDLGKSGLADSSGRMTAIFPQIDLFGQIFPFPTQAQPSNQKACILRC